MWGLYVNLVWGISRLLECFKKLLSQLGMSEGVDLWYLPQILKSDVGYVPLKVIGKFYLDKIIVCYSSCYTIVGRSEQGWDREHGQERREACWGGQKEKGSI